MNVIYIGCKKKKKKEKKSDPNCLHLTDLCQNSAKKKKRKKGFGWQYKCTYHFNTLHFLLPSLADHCKRVIKCHPEKAEFPLESVSSLESDYFILS